MGIFSWIVLGLIVGVIAKVLVPGRDRGGLIFTVLLGVIGALAGGWAASELGWGKVDGINVKSLGIATCGAVIVLWLRKKLFGSGR